MFVISLKNWLSSILPATACGILLALAQVFGNRFARSAVVGYLFIVRGIPLLVLLTFTYYLLPLTGIDLPPFWGVVLVMALYYAAFMSQYRSRAAEDGEPVPWRLIRIVWCWRLRRRRGLRRCPNCWMRLG